MPEKKNKEWYMVHRSRRKNLVDRVAQKIFTKVFLKWASKQLIHLKIERKVDDDRKKKGK